MATQMHDMGKASRKPDGRKNEDQRANPGSYAGANETGTRDEIFNVISVLYHALQGAETYAQYVRDARESGDEELASFFSEIQDEECDRAQRAKNLLARRVGRGTHDAE